METLILQTDKVKKTGKRIEFNVPTAMTKLDPIYSLEFNLEEPTWVKISLNSTLRNTLDEDFYIYHFDTDNYCDFHLHSIDDYFIKGEIKLVPMHADQQVLLNNCSHCHMNITYGKKKSELFYLKGTFKLSDFVTK